MKKKLDQYKGVLSPAEATVGINAAIANANRLVEDAQLLLDKKRFPSAASLAALSIEESGKTAILRGLALALNGDDLKISWREYRSHTRKNVMWLFTDLIARGANKLDDFAELYREDAEHPFILDQLKQLGFYTDCLGQCHWSEPDQVISEDLAHALVRNAKFLAGKRTISVRELELWVHFLKPVWKGHKEHMEHALVQWHEAVHRENIVPESDMEQFINEGLSLQKNRNNRSSSQGIQPT